jgi:hypothetical protein
MSVLIGIATDKIVHLLTDAAGVDAGTGIIHEIGSKQLCREDGTVIAMTGWSPPGYRFASLAQNLPFDALVDAAPALWQQTREGVPAEFASVGFGILLASWSRRRSALRMLEFNSKAEPDGADLTAFAVGPTEEAATPTNAFVARFGTCPDAFDPLRDGVALAEALRRQARRQFKTGAQACVGGFLQLTSVTFSDTTTRVVHRWPADRIGAPIDLDEKEAA